MSYDVDLIIDTGPGHYASAWDDNITYNLGPMMRAVGIDLNKLHGHPATGAYPILKDAYIDLFENPDKYKQLNPENGWGNYSICLKFVREFRDACHAHPFTKVRVT